MGELDIVCVYHADCQDGFTAAWVIWSCFGDGVAFYRGVHGEEPPYDMLADKHVVMVDFSYPLPIIEKISPRCKSLLILDHHKSAREALLDLPKVLPNGLLGQSPLWPRDHMLKIGVLFDMEKSGAGLAWTYFFPDTPMPRFIQHVQDRDLWKFKLTNTREISEYAFSQPYDFQVFDELVCNCEVPYHRAKMIEQGAAILRKHDKDIAELVPLTQRTSVIGGYKVPIANLPHTMASDAAGKMAEGNPFAATYYDGRTHRHWSLRSRGDGIDVSEVAKQYGGGGHRSAAGFRTEIGWEGDPDWCSTGVV